MLDSPAISERYHNKRVRLFFSVQSEDLFTRFARKLFPLYVSVILWVQSWVQEMPLQNILTSSRVIIPKKTNRRRFTRHGCNSRDTANFLRDLKRLNNLVNASCPCTRIQNKSHTCRQLFALYVHRIKSFKIPRASPIYIEYVISLRRLNMLFGT